MSNNSESDYNIRSKSYKANNQSQYNTQNLGYRRRIESVSAVSSVSSMSTASYGSNNGYNTQQINNQNFSSTSPLQSPTFNTGGGFYTSTTSDYDGRYHSSTSPTPNHSSIKLPSVTSPTLQNSENSSYFNQITNNLSPPMSINTNRYVGNNRVNSTEYNYSEVGIETRNSYVNDVSSYIEMHDLSISSGASTQKEFDALQYPIFPPTKDAIEKLCADLKVSEATFRVIYAGDATYKPEKKLLNKSKRAHFVLTNNYLLIYKNSQKARNQINIFEQSNEAISAAAAMKLLDKDNVFLNLRDVFAVQAVTTAVNTFRIEYIHPQSGQALAHVLTVDTDKESQQWIKAFRKAVRVHHPHINCITATERYQVHDRLAKQNDLFENTSQVKIYKVVFKEKRHKIANEQPKEIFLPVLFAIGKFSFYFLPMVAGDEYLKTVERDRFGLLSIHSIRYEDKDDTVILEVKQVGKNNRQLVFVSTFCEEIVQYLYRSIHSIIPELTSNLYTHRVPAHIKHARIIPLQLPSDLDPNDISSNTDEEIGQFGIVLRAYAAAMNLNKSRINFSIHGLKDSKVFCLLPPNEVNRTPPNYEKYELLAVLRTIQYNNIFVKISFADQPLNILEEWEITADNSWIYNKKHPLNAENVLSNELYNILINLKSLRKLDLTNCAIGTFIDNKQEYIKNSALGTLGVVMKLGLTNIDCISIGKNKITENDVKKLLQGIKEHKQSIKELHLNECGLEKDMIESVLKTLYDKNMDKIISLDLSLKADRIGIIINQSLSEAIVPKFKRLEELRMRGHNLLDIGYRFMLESTNLKILDLSGVRMNDEYINRLCNWIHMPSFDSIKELHVGSCFLNGRHAYEIMSSISQSRNKSVHLNLENNPIMKDSKHLPRLFSTLAQGEGPTSISFARLEWDDAALHEFVDCLRDNQSINHLNLSDISMKEEISEDTVRMFTLFFERNATIKELDLSFKYNKAKVSLSAFQTKSPIGNTIVKALPGLQHNRAIQHLDISGLNIEDNGAMALIRVLKINRVLRSIVIDSNNISIEGYKGLLNAIEEYATQIINLPRPQCDLRYQLKYLLFRIEDLIISENEAQFFLIHTTASDKKRAKKHELEMIIQERKTCELSVKNFEGVINSIQLVIQKNFKESEARNYKDMEYRMQAEISAQNLSQAQVHIQERIPTITTNITMVSPPPNRIIRDGSIGNMSTASSSNNSNYGIHQNRHLGKTNSNQQFRVSVGESQYSTGSLNSFNDSRVYHQETVDSYLRKPHTYNDNETNQPPPLPLHQSENYQKQYTYYESPIQSPIQSSIQSPIRSPKEQTYQSRNFTKYPPEFYQNQYYQETFDYTDGFGYVDEFDQEFIDPQFQGIQNRGNSSQHQNWEEEEFQQRNNRGLYLPPDEKN